MFTQSCLRTSNMPNHSHHQKDSSSYQDASDEGDKDEKRLDIVDLSKSSLRDIPDPCMSLASICKLDLSNNNIQYIPESVIARLLNLMVLDVHSNQLASLPNSIGCLSKLKLLNISSNMLRCLPKTIENCRSLEELNANFNKLTRLPETIGFELVNLKKLSINSNQIMFLPYSISHMAALRILDVRLNCLRSLPNDLENLINLQVLNISQNFNYLNKLPYSIGFLLSLVELDVTYNSISTLPPSMSCLRKLQRLHVEGNPIVCPPLEVVDMGLHAVKLYLAGQLNLEQQSLPKRKKKSSWLGNFKLNGKTRSRANEDILEGSFVARRSIEVIASPRSLATVSPRRLFSAPRCSLTKLH